MAKLGYITFSQSTLKKSRNQSYHRWGNDTEIKKKNVHLRDRHATTLSIKEEHYNPKFSCSCFHEGNNLGSRKDVLN
jgi:hypothetical protein